MATAQLPDSPQILHVAFDYEYDYKTRKVAIKQGEPLQLLQKTNEHWWKVIRPGINKPFFVPAQYVTSPSDDDEDDGENEDDHNNGDLEEVVQISNSRAADESIGRSSSGSNYKNDNNNKDKEYDLPPPKVKVKNLKEAASRSKSNESTSFLLKAFSKATKINRNDGTRASHRDRERDRGGKFSSSTKISSSSSGKLKNWSASLEELSRQIVFPGLTAESVADLSSTSSRANNASGPVNARRENESEYFSLRDEEEMNDNIFGGGSSSNHSFHCDNNQSQHINSNSANQCLTFRNPTFSNSSDSSRDNKMKMGTSVGNHPSASEFDWDSHAIEKGMESDCNISRSSTSSINKDSRLPATPKHPPVRKLAENWGEYYCPDIHRYFYYNSKSHITSWKPPRFSSNKKSEEQMGSSLSDGSANTSSLDGLENIPDLIGSPSLSFEVDSPERVHNLSSDRSDNEILLGTATSNSLILKRNSRESRSSDSVASASNNSKLQQSEDEEQTTENSVVEMCSSGNNNADQIPIPEGWDTQWDETCQQICYVNKITGARWFASTDTQERVYFYEENTSNSSWLLPRVPEGTYSNENQSPTLKEATIEEEAPLGKGPVDRLKPAVVKKRHSAGEVSDRSLKTKSLMLSSDLRKHEFEKSNKKSDSLPRNKLSIWATGERNDVIREGPIARSKITENGKKLRKSWGVVWGVLTEAHLSLFKDQKSYNALTKTEVEIELEGSMLEWTEEKSSRKNVFQLSSYAELQMLFQVDDKELAMKWFDDIWRAMAKFHLSPDISMRLRSTESPEHFLDSPAVGERKTSRLSRKSTKIRITTVDEKSERGIITAHLRKFFSRRPPRESLVKKGIYKDESVFGCSLEKLCALEKRQVPRFVEECILAIEVKEENLKTDGLYRASGNLSQVQKIRLQVDQNNMNCLISEEDVHVLAGCLKLFFRELKEPLIPSDLFERGLQASNAPNKKEKVAKLKEVINLLPKPNKCTLQALLKHLLKVASFAEHNRMQVPNLAIVFGPTLMCAAETMNMASDLMQQNYVIEALLLEYDSIFQ